MVALTAAHVPDAREVLEAQIAGYLADSTTCVGFVVIEDASVVAWGIARHLSPKIVDEDHAPPGWYLLGVIVRPDRQRRGHGAALTRARLDWLAPRTDRVYYFTDVDNEASQCLHASFGFRRLRGGLTHRTLTFDGGPMTLYELDLSPGAG